MCEILKSIQAVADPEKDKVIILMANLVDNQFSRLNEKMDGISVALKDIGDFIHDHGQCPVIGEEEKVKLILMLAKYPKVTAVVIIGILTSMGISLGVDHTQILSWLN
jgi:hypothetical protein